MYIMSTAIVNSYNIYIDSDRFRSPDSTGENLRLELGNTPILCADNQYIRLSLQSFSMYKTWPNVNDNNNQFRIVATQEINSRTIAGSEAHRLTNGDYTSVRDLAADFAEQLRARFEVYVGAACTVHDIRPDLSDNAPTNHIIFTLKFAGGNPVQWTTLPVVGFPTRLGDAYALLGGDRDNDFHVSNLSPGVIVTTGQAGTSDLVFKCRYPAQLSTERNVYIRTDLATTNLQTSSYNAENRDANVGDNMMSSRILGIASQIIRDNVPEVVFETNTNDEYFINLQDRSLVECRLYLTDSKGRKLPSGALFEHQHPDLDKQSTLGNRNFEAVLKVDIVQYIGQQNNRLLSEPVKYNVAPRFGTEPLKNLDYGDTHYADPDFSKIKK